MRSRRVFFVLELLEADERHLFREFLVSPLFLGSRTLLRFYDLWEERVMGAPNEIEPESFLEESGFQLSRLDKLCSQLLRALLDFFSFREYQANQGLQQECLSQGLERRGAPEQETKRQQDRFGKWLAKQPLSAQHYHETLVLSWRIAESHARSRQTRALWKEDFRGLHDQLDNYYFLQKLKLASASANARRMFNQESEPETEFLQYFRKLVSDSPVQSPLTQAYLLTLESASSPDDPAPMRQLLDLLQERGQDFERDEATELYQYALNFCIRKANQGVQVFKEFTNSLYRDLLEKEMLQVEGRISSQTMKNLVASHCRSGQLEWVERFIDEYRDRLIEGTDPAIIAYNEAVLNFYRKNYGDAIRVLKEVISQLKDDIFFELDARVFLWKAYFEHYDMLSLEEVDEMERMYDSFRIFIDRNKKISEVHKLQYRNFIREFKRLLVLFQQEPLPVEQLNAFREEIREMEYTYNQDWFLEKIGVLLKG